MFWLQISTMGLDFKFKSQSKCPLKSSTMTHKSNILFRALRIPCNFIRSFWFLWSILRRCSCERLCRLTLHRISTNGSTLSIFPFLLCPLHCCPSVTLHNISRLPLSLQEFFSSCTNIEVVYNNTVIDNVFTLLCTINNV